MESHCLPEGTLISGSYKVLSSLGIGGMSHVYKCQDMTLNRFVALKVMREDISVTPQGVMRFQREGQAIALLSHPNIVKVHSLQFTETGQPFMVMEIVSGISLAEVLLKNGPIQLFRVARIANQICDALQEAHSHGIVHRDLKPDNIMLIRAGSADEQVKLLDFGIAKILTEHSVSATQTGEVFGSPAYMSPEQALGLPVDIKSDQYSLGCVLFELLTGKPPFTAEAPLKVIMAHAQDKAPTLKLASKKEFPDYVERSIARMLRKDPNERYPSITEARSAFLGESKSKSDRSPGQKTKYLLLATAAVASIILAASAIGIVSQNQHPKPTAPTYVDSVNLPSEQRKYGDQAFSLWLRQNPNIEQLRVSKISPMITDKGLSVFADVRPPRLRTLVLRDCDQVTNEGLKYLKFLPALDELELSETRLGEQSLPYVGDLTTLRTLNLSRMSISDRAIEQLCDTPVASVLRNLDLNETGIGDETVEAVCRMKRLKNLQLSHNHFVDDACVPFFANLKELEDINLGTTAVTGATLYKLENLKSLKKISLRKDPVGKYLADIGKLPLNVLDIRECSLTDDNLKDLEGSNIKTLKLSGNDISDEGLMKLAALPRLILVKAANTAVSAKGVAEFLEKHKHLTGIDASVDTKSKD